MTYRQKLITTLARLLRVEPPVRLVPESYEVRVPADPVEMLETLHDDPGRVYVWICREGTTDDQMALIAESLGDRRALHVVVRDVAEIRKFDPTDIRKYLAPIVKRAEEGGWQ